MINTITTGYTRQRLVPGYNDIQAASLRDKSEGLSVILWFIKMKACEKIP